MAWKRLKFKALRYQEKWLDKVGKVEILGRPKVSRKLFSKVKMSTFASKTLVIKMVSTELQFRPRAGLALAFALAFASAKVAWKIHWPPSTPSAMTA